LWKHCNAVAILAKLIFRREFSKPGENAYIAGLLHDIGIIVEDQFMQEEFKNCILTSEKNKENLFEIEKNVFGFDHGRIGQEMAKNWKFPDELVYSIGGHHYPDEVEEPFRELALTLFVADHVCQTTNLGYGDSQYTRDVVYKKVLRELDISPVAIELLLDEVTEELEKMEKAGWF
jgi:putative nucleotidyltransferase with HDIG domain